MDYPTNRQSLEAPPLDLLPLADGDLAPIPSLDSSTRNMCKTLLPFYILDPSKY